MVPVLLLVSGLLERAEITRDEGMLGQAVGSSAFSVTQLSALFFTLHSHEDPRFLANGGPEC